MTLARRLAVDAAVVPDEMKLPSRRPIVALASVTVGLRGAVGAGQHHRRDRGGVVLGDGEAQRAAIGDDQIMDIDRAAGGRGHEQLAVIVHMDVQAARRRHDDAVDIAEAADMQQIADARAETDEYWSR